MTKTLSQALASIEDAILSDQYEYEDGYSDYSPISVIKTNPSAAYQAGWDDARDVFQDLVKGA